MKHSIFLLALLFLITSCSQGKSSGEDTSKLESGKSGKKEFRKIDVDKEWGENPFTWFKGYGLLLASGDKENNNAMTIGWGSLGNIWQEAGLNAVTVYVAEGRYTYQFMEKYDYFTIMGFKKEDARILGYMGTHSGRDGDKAAHLGLHTLYTENGTPYYEEAEIVLECKVIYRAPMLKEGMCDEVKKFYENFDAGVHHEYIGNIVNAWVKK